MDHRDDIPVACRLGDAARVERRREFQEGLLRDVREIRELHDGYALRFEWSPERLRRIGELVALESDCCPFLRFALEVEPGRTTVWLRLTGPPGTKDLVGGLASRGGAIEPR